MTQDKALTILKSGENVFLTGEPGAGKTHTINRFTEWLRAKGIPYAVTASTGIAATHINGMTIHSWSSLGIKSDITDVQIEEIMSKPYAVKQMSSPRVLIIDEISMLNAQTLDDVDRILRGVRNTFLSGEPFGGLQVVLVGDFFQLPPVSRTGKAKFAFASKAWEEAELSVCYLHEQYRQNDQKFLEILKAMRQGRVQDSHKHNLLAKKESALPETKLFTHNIDVDRLNDQELEKLTTESYRFKMEGSGIPFLVETLKKHCLSPEILELKIGAVVMFTKNKFEDGEAVYVNGTIGRVMDFDGYTPLVATKDGTVIRVEDASWSIEENGYKKATITQLPLRLAWAITIHKSQGMSLDCAIVDLSKAFEHGQGYVAISRVRSLDGLHLVGMNDKALSMHPEVIKQDNIFRALSDEAENK